MKTLLIMRHGKSDWNSVSGSDHDRPLAERGIKAARRMGNYLRSTAQMPEFIIASTAERAASTARLAAESAGFSGEIHLSPDLYYQGETGAMDEIANAPGQCSHLMLVGHEPWASGLTSRLIGNGGLSFPTAAISCIELPIKSWAKVSYGIGELLWFITPRLVKSLLK